MRDLRPLDKRPRRRKKKHDNDDAARWLRWHRDDKPSVSVKAERQQRLRYEREKMRRLAAERKRGGRPDPREGRG
jgi:hypothetical protein